MHFDSFDTFFSKISNQCNGYYKNLAHNGKLNDVYMNKRKDQILCLNDKLVVKHHDFV